MKNKSWAVALAALTFTTLTLSLASAARAQEKEGVASLSGQEQTLTNPLVWQEQVLHNLGANAQDGTIASGGLISDSAGNLYGTTTYGGTHGAVCNGVTCGTVFELVKTSTPGKFTYKRLHSFKGSDGFGPTAGLVFDKAGNLYGTTEFGGANIGGAGFGTVFELSPGANGEWTEQVLHNFSNVGGDGWYPDSRLTIDEAGNLYGETLNGGVVLCEGPGCGTVFELSSVQGQWTEKVIYSLGTSAGFNGDSPVGGLVFDKEGNLYGAAQSHGAFGGGVVFELTPGADGEWTGIILYSFGTAGAKDGYSPSSDLVLDAQGNLYGTTFLGGTDTSCVYGQGCGTVFELIKPRPGGLWTEKVLHNFQNNGIDGDNPVSGLIWDQAGNLYGTTRSGGTSSACITNCGTVFELTPVANGLAWKENVLLNFNSQNGSDPLADLTIDGAGNLYGTTELGGTNGGGVVFSLTPTP